MATSDPEAGNLMGRAVAALISGVTVWAARSLAARRISARKMGAISRQLSKVEAWARGAAAAADTASASSRANGLAISEMREDLDARIDALRVHVDGRIEAERRERREEVNRVWDELNRRRQQ